MSRRNKVRSHIRRKGHVHWIWHPGGHHQWPRGEEFHWSGGTEARFLNEITGNSTCRSLFQITWLWNKGKFSNGNQRGFDLSEYWRKRGMREEDIVGTGEKGAGQWTIPKKLRGIPSLMEGETLFTEARGKETGQVKRGLRWLGKKLREFLPDGLNFHCGRDEETSP